MKQTLLTTLALTFCSTLTYADEIRVGQPAYGGNGCPNGSMSARLSPDLKDIHFYFDQFQAEAGRSSGRAVDRKSCNLAIPVHIPKGMSIALFQVEYRGYNSLPEGGKSHLEAEYFFAGQTGPKYQKDFSGPLASNYVTTNSLLPSSLIWTPCGTDSAIFRINSSIMAKTNSAKDPTIATVDSADIKTGIIYRFQWKNCH